jgi:hypothetical protein
MPPSSNQDSAVPQPVSWRLPAVLLEAVDNQAALEGVPAEEIAVRVMEAGLSELGLMPHGRCSVRTGVCGAGPLPLPIQQSCS